MPKKLIRFMFILILVVLFLGVFTPWLDGYIFKQRYLSLLNSFNSQGSNYTINNVKYSEGIYHSTLDITFTLPSLSGSLTGHEVITHGPFILNKTSPQLRLGLALVSGDIVFPDSFKPYLDTASKAVTTHYNVFADFSGAYVTHFDVPAFIYSSYPITRLSVNGISVDTTIHTVNDAYQDSQTQLNMDTVAMVFGTAKVNMNSFTMKTNLKLTRTGQYEGHVEYTLPELIMSNDSNNIVIDGFQVTSDFGLNKNNLYDLSGNISIKKINSDLIDAVFPLDTISTDIAMQNINPHVINILSTALDTTANTQNKVQMLLAMAPTLFNDKSHFKQSISLNTQKGKLMESAEYAFPPDVASLSTSDMLKKLSVTMDLNVPADLVQQYLNWHFSKYPNRDAIVQFYTEQLDAWKKQGLVTENAGELATIYKHDENTTTFNGLPIPTGFAHSTAKLQYKNTCPSVDAVNQKVMAMQNKLRDIWSDNKKVAWFIDLSHAKPPFTASGFKTAIVAINSGHVVCVYKNNNTPNQMIMAISINKAQENDYFSRRIPVVNPKVVVCDSGSLPENCDFNLVPRAVQTGNSFDIGSQ